MIGQRFHRHAGVSTMRRYGTLNGVGFWDALDSLDLFGDASDFAFDAADFSFDVPSFDMGDLAFDASDYTFDAGALDLEDAAFGALDVPALDASMLDYIEGGGGADVPEMSFEDYVRESGGQMVNDAPIQALEDTDWGMDYGGVPGSTFLDADHPAINPVAPSGSVTLPSIPSLPGSGSGGGGNAPSQTVRVERGPLETASSGINSGAILDAAGNILKAATEAAPKLLNVYSTYAQREAQLDAQRAALDRYNELRQGVPGLAPTLNPLGAGGSVLDTLTRSVRENPVPWALGAGAAVLLLFASTSGGSRRRVSFRARARSKRGKR